jgi:ribosome-associated toxin RatA of RatAB toxin-antitoxin module
VRTVTLQLNIPGRSPGEVYTTLADFELYPQLSDAVQSVAVTSVDADTTISRWEVTFRSGLLRWIEEDRFDPTELSITFRQLEGDVALFDGSWRCSRVEGAESSTRITFCARLDMGIPSLADALEPIAVRTLVDNTVSIVSGLFGTAELISSEVGVPAVAGSRT